MRSLIIFGLILVFNLLKSTFISLNLLFGLICFLALSLPAKEIFFWAFLAGFFLDLFSGGPLGFSSLGFLVVAGLFVFYRQRFSFKNPLIVFVFVFVANFLFSFFSQKPFFLKEALFWAVAFFLLRILLPFLFESFSQGFKIKVRSMI